MPAPQSCPTSTADRSPRASTTATLSATSSSIRYASTGSGRDERP